MLLRIITLRLLDALVWLLAGELAAELVFGRLYHEDYGNVHQTLIYLSPFITWLVSPAAGQYRVGWDEEGALKIAGRILLGCFATFACGIIIVYIVLHQSHVLSRLWWGLTLLFAFALSGMLRIVAFGVDRRAGFRRGIRSYKRRIAVMGSEKPVKALINRLMNDADAGYRVEAALCDADIGAAPEVNKLQTLEQLETFVYQHHIREVWLMPDPERVYDWREAITRLENTATTLRWFPVMPAAVTEKFGYCAGAPSFELNAAVIDSKGVLHKTLFDRLFSLVVLLMLSPLLSAIAVAIKLSSPGPVLFRQLRHGVGGKAFTCLKFRTMKLHQEQDKVTQAKTHDPRTTKVGRFLRKTSLDELPQFINVLMGDMSVVGPRPHAVQHNDYYSHEIQRYMFRHKVKPGITGWAQINGCRGETDTLDKMQRRVDLDIYYIRHWSFWLDVKIVFWTAFRGWSGKHVY
ncbi:undecaprenyl-phosphate glucose phosphotransferase [Candidatus Methylospira mobilis]|uniref:undecaprenyl-phosphate glucose phosphotransferase n=1 Tax=Candidatus Methylospira mobilis TaxID=1808979 RepID=UPI0028EC5CA5|nr:undecaprenyl-phosphate glucose phosphotransferase [Candidatus Methylospira mobilis]WNV03054.1 undecaprenyl-phosphate glucose phosphotransferase [Candidatus Methylospira mobilis]